jgi:hypothetical protein
MSETITAFVEKVFHNERTGRNGPYTLHSFKVQDPETGKVDPIYYNCSFDNPETEVPGFKEGAYVRFTATVSEYSKTGKDVDVKTIQVSTKPPSRPDNPEPYKAKGGKGGKGGGGGYQKDPKVQKAINYQAARNSAIALIEVLLENEGLPVIGTSGKAAKAKRYEEILAFVDKLTVRFYNDTDTLRRLELVDDEGELDAEPETGDAAEKLDARVEAAAEDDGGFDDAQEGQSDDGFE